MSSGTGVTRVVELLRRGFLLSVASATFLVLSFAASSHADSVQGIAVRAPNKHGELPTAATANFAVTPTIGPASREFLRSRSDVSRSILVGRIVIPLMLILLAEGELLSVGGRTEGRTIVAFGMPMLAVFAVLAYGRIRNYIG
jgi:hypothetical protein